MYGKQLLWMLYPIINPLFYIFRKILNMKCPLTTYKSPDRYRDSMINKALHLTIKK